MDNTITTTTTTIPVAPTGIPAITDSTIPLQLPVQVQVQLPASPTTETVVKKTVVMSSDQHNPLIRKKNSLGYYLTLGMRGLLGSKKGTFSLFVLLVTTVALFTSKISGMEFCSAITIIAGIYAAGATATDIQNIRSQ